jgi:hypothetical protein
VYHSGAHHVTDGDVTLWGSGFGPIGGGTVEPIRHQRVKLLIAGSGAIALVVIGTVAAFVVGHQQTGTVAIGLMTMGGTATTSTPPSVEPTAQARPGLKASRPHGF